VTGRFSQWLDRWAAKGSGLTAAELRHELDEAHRAWDALADGDLGEADTLAKALMAKVADRRPLHGSSDEHSAHLIIGHVCLRRGDVDAAERHLLAAARIDDPAPALCTFGPNMSLAQALLQHGRTDSVIEYFDLCSSFWKRPMSLGQLKRWRTDVREGRMPDFKANLVYGTGQCGYVPLSAGRSERVETAASTGEPREGQRPLTLWIVAAALLLAAGWVGLRLGRPRKRIRPAPSPWQLVRPAEDGRLWRPPAGQVPALPAPA
jgi:hypothetical protein